MRERKRVRKTGNTKDKMYKRKNGGKKSKTRKRKKSVCERKKERMNPNDPMTPQSFTAESNQIK